MIACASVCAFHMRIFLREGEPKKRLCKRSSISDHSRDFYVLLCKSEHTHMYKRVVALNVLCAQWLIHYAHSSKELPTQCLVTMLQLKPATHDCGVVYAASRQCKQQYFIICTSSWVWRQSLIALLCSVLRSDESTKAVGKFVCQCYDVDFVEGKKFSYYRLNHVALSCLNYLRLVRCCAHRL